MVIEIVAPTEEEKAAIPKVDLFSLEGKTYQIDDRVQPNVSLKYLWLIRTQGPVVADEWLGTTLFGAEAYVAYLNCSYISQEQSDAIWAEAKAIAFGERAPKSESESQKATSGPRRKPSSSTRRSNGSRTAKSPSKATTRTSTRSRTAGKTSPATASGDS